MKNPKNNTTKQELPALPETPEGARRANTIAGMIVLFFIGVAFYIRGIIPLERAYLKEGLTFAMDDAVFHMRLVENTIANFPRRIFYDAFTNYPYGNPLHWGALFEQTIAAISIVAGWIFDGGAPSQATVNTVGAFYPAVLGALCVIPAYVIAKELAGRKAGIIAAALTALLPGQFLSRSVLGFTDNHIAEVLFLSMAVMFYVMTLKHSESLTFANFRNGNFSIMRSGLISAVLSGFFLGIYLLNWTAGVFFVVVFGVFIGVQFIIDFLKSKSTEYLMITSIPVFIIPILLVSPYIELRNGFDSAYYSLLHIIVPLIGLAVTSIFYVISKKVTQIQTKPKHNKILYLILLAIVIGVGTLILKLVLPEMYAGTLGNLEIMFSARTGGQATVAEAQIMSISTALGYFGLNYYLSFIGLAIIGYVSLVKHKAEHTLVAIWSIFILLITLAQVRFSYYYAINVAVMTSVFVASCLNLFGWKGYNLNSWKSTIRGIKPLPVVVLVLFISIMIFLPAGASIYTISTMSTKNGALSPGYYEWYFAMNWMKNNTPDTGVDYLGIYERPPNGEKYPYPETAYGVMSWWDYGHVISYWGHRIPNANPFQANIPEVATFLTAQSEEEGNKVMDRLGSKYVVTDSFMAYGIQGIFATWLNDNTIIDPVVNGRTNFNGYYYSYVRTNQGISPIPALKTFKSMTGRLHILDTTGLERYRLIHETPASPNSMAAKIGRGTDVEKQFKYVYNQLFQGNIPQEDSGYVKIFEYVKGAQVIGTAPGNTTVELSLDIRTNTGRNFIYQQETTADTNGNFKLVVPYSTVGEGETKFDTQSISKYKITAGNNTIEFDMNEQDVLNGGTISVVIP